MKSFPYHIVFELHESSIDKGLTINEKFTVPPPGTDIFSVDLPTDSIPEWSRSICSSTYDSVISSPHDWRYSKVSIISINMNQSKSKAPLADNTIKAVFFPEQAKTTDVGYGVVHLYRDIKENPKPSLAEPSQSSTFDSDQCDTLCIVAVPSYMTPSDLLGYVGDKTAREDVSHFRLIRTDRTNKYMVLLKFREAKQARDWRQIYNGKTFNTMEPEYCHVVFVSSITFQTPQQASSFPNMLNDPFQPDQMIVSQSAKPLAPPTASLVELPTCPVCLERMDETTGLLIILCQHVFHCACLEKWKGSGCPVCRYTQNNGLPTHGEACSGCGSTQNLWICLICGNVACGRYDNAHAYGHWEETRHSYVMDINTQHVWDYVGDGYVHRLIQNKGDGKLMNLPEASKKEDGISAFGADMVPREKMDAMGNEYAYLLTSQLESQRSYFEEQLERAVDKREKAVLLQESTSQKFELLQSSLEDAQSQIKSLNRDLERTQKRAEKTDGLARKFGSDWKEEKAMNDSLLERVKFLEEKVSELEVSKRELEEQNRDLSFFISGSERLKDAGEEIVEGTVEVGAAESSNGNSKKKRGKGRR